MVTPLEEFLSSDGLIYFRLDKSQKIKLKAVLYSSPWYNLGNYIVDLSKFGLNDGYEYFGFREGQFVQLIETMVNSQDNNGKDIDLDDYLIKLTFRSDDSTEIEYWREVHPSTGYFISSLGNIIGIRKRLKPGKDRSGYLHVNIHGKTKRISRLVAIAFIPNPENKPEVDHIDRKRHNNRVENLRWATREENKKNTITWIEGEEKRLRKTKEFMEGLIDEFIQDQIIDGDRNDRIRPRQLYYIFCNWCELNKKLGMTEVAFSKIMRTKYERIISRGNHFYIGLKVISSEEVSD